MSRSSRATVLRLMFSLSAVCWWVSPWARLSMMSYVRGVGRFSCVMFVSLMLYDDCYCLLFCLFGGWCGFFASGVLFEITEETVFQFHCFSEVRTITFHCVFILCSVNLFFLWVLLCGFGFVWFLVGLLLCWFVLFGTFLC